MRQWALQDAKARLSEVVRLATGHEPQEITQRGEPACSGACAGGLRPLDHTTPRESLVEFMRRSPLYGAEDIAFPRDQSMTREAGL